MSITKLKAGDTILCDPEFSPEANRENRKPLCTIPAKIIEVDMQKGNAKVEIINNAHPSQPRGPSGPIYTNKDIWGDTCYVLLTAIQKTAA